MSVASNWQTVLPAGRFLAHSVTIRSDQNGLSARLEDRLTLSCRRDEEGWIHVTDPKASWEGLVYQPETGTYGVEEGYAGWYRRETLDPDGTYRYRAEGGAGPCEAVQRPDGSLTGATRNAASTVQMRGNSIVFGAAVPLGKAMREHGLLGGLWAAAHSLTQTPISFCLSQPLFSRFQPDPADDPTLPQRLVGPHQPSGVQLGSERVTLPGVSLRLRSAR